MTDPTKQARLDTIRQKVGDFCIIHGDELVTNYAMKLCDELFQSDGLDATRGDVDVWAASILFAAVKATRPYLAESLRVLSSTDVCRYYAVREKEIAHLASRLRKIFRIDVKAMATSSPETDLTAPVSEPARGGTSGKDEAKDAASAEVEEEEHIVEEEIVAVSEEKKKRKQHRRQMSLFDDG